MISVHATKSMEQQYYYGKSGEGVYRSLARSVMVILVAIFVLIMAGGCGKDKRAIADADAKLDLARSKSDLDGMYLALRTLYSLGVNEGRYAEELDLVEETLPLQEEMAVLLAEHDHERALWCAAEILRAFPNHVGARSTLLGSGEIVRLYAQSAKLVKSCFKLDADSMAVLVGGEDGEVDYELVAGRLREANECLDEVRALDPLFPPITSAAERLEGARDVLCTKLAIDVFEGTNEALELADVTGVFVYNRVATAGSSASFYLRGMRSSCQKSLSEVDSLISIQLLQVKALREFSTASTGQLAAATEEYVTLAPGYANQFLLYPGSVSKWLDAINNARARIVEHKNQVLLQLPNSDQVRHDAERLTSLIDTPLPLNDTEKTLGLLEGIKTSQ